MGAAITQRKRETMAQYNLQILDDNGNVQCDVGTFSSEAELAQWCKENMGAIENN